MERWRGENDEELDVAEGVGWHEGAEASETARQRCTRVTVRIQEVLTVLTPRSEHIES